MKTNKQPQNGQPIEKKTEKQPDRQTAAVGAGGGKVKSKIFRFFGKYDFRDRKFYERLGKRILFSLVIIVQLLMLIDFVELYTVLRNGWLFLWVFSLSAGLTFLE